MNGGNPGSGGSSNAELKSSYSLQKFTLYETQMKFYLVGRDKSRSRWRVLKIDRSETAELNVYEDPAIYTRQDCNEFLRRLADGNRASGGLNFVTKAYGIVGFIKFLEPYYMIVITKRKLLGSICGHSIYGISESRLVTVPHSSVLTSITFSKSENRYKRLFNSIDLSRNFFYSHTYRIMWSLQRNAITSNVDSIPYDDMFVWNSFLTRKFRSESKSELWTVAIVHGYFKQVKLVCESRNFTLTLVARRSRHYAGTRYLKRGVNEKGRVANDVETEQLVHGEDVDEITSIVQHRGSIPLFWSQDTSVLSLKPDIKLHQNGPTYEATSLHFQNLAARYGNPIVVLNLVKTVEKRPRETILCREYANSVAYLNHNLPKSDRIKFIQLDFHLFLKRKSHNMLEVLESIAWDVLDLVGFYYSGKTSANDSDGVLNVLKHVIQQPAKRMFQHGVLRTNCIDCLDRTNVAQYAFGLAALCRQMLVLGLSSTLQPGWNSSLAIAMMELYENMGDVLALQYGGSTAHNKVFSKWQGKWDATIQSQEFFRSLVRHYNNALLDGEKQDAINIFLGHFRPERGKLALWQLDSDNHLQFRRAGDDPMNDLRLSFKRSFSAEDMFEKNDSANMLSEDDPGMDSNVISSSLVAKKNTLSMEKRGVTISEAELKKCLTNEDGFKCLSDVRHDRADPSLLSLYSSLYRSVDASRYLGDCVDADWLSSSGNSCEEDAQERYWVTAAGSDSWQGSGLLTDTFKKSEESDDPDDSFQDLTALLMRAKSFRLNDNVFFGRENKENVESEDAGSQDGTVQSEEAQSSELFSERFVNWIQEGQILCF